MALSRRGFLALTCGAAASLVAACGSAAPARPAPTDPPKGADRSAKPVDLWNGAGIDAKVLFQREVDQLPEAPYMLRVTELDSRRCSSRRSAWLSGSDSWCGFASGWRPGF